MTDTAIRVENLSKRYRIGLKEERHDTFAGALGDWFRRPATNLRRLQRLSRFTEENAADVIWALKDISFEVKKGEVLGVIGRNGAGKSTLLKILSRITYPTNGRVELEGRVSSLLEVGTGFHPELTGRENIYLNGTILGMTRREIDRKFDEIVDFSGVEKFIDTPVKRYSSGMRVRLAFSVAAHLEPEILLIDEVLAVGDAEFQKKCLGKMGEVATEGRTVLFVSHNIAAIQQLCESTIVLENGKLNFNGPVSAGINEYLGSSPVIDSQVHDLTNHPNRRQNGRKILRSIRLLDREGHPTNNFPTGETVVIELNFDAEEIIFKPQFGIGVEDSIGSRVFSARTDISGYEIPYIREKGIMRCVIENLPLSPGRYFLSLSVGEIHGRLIDAIDNAVALFVEEGDFFGTGKLPPLNLGKILVKSSWNSESIHES